MLTLVKNNLKLMMRNKLFIVFYLIAPIIIISALTNAFKGLLENGYNVSDIKVGYQVNSDEYKEICDEMTSDNDFLNFIEYNDTDPEDAIKDGNLDAFVSINEDECTVYSNNTGNVKTRLVTWMINNIPYVATISQMQVESGENLLCEPTISELPYNRTATSSEYYGIIEVVYFLCMTIVFLASVMTSEKKGRITTRYATTPISKIGLYLGKFIPCQIIVMICTVISTLIATYLFDIHWGNIPGTIGILLLTSLASTAFGVALLTLFDKLAIALIVDFALVWVAGFVGGSFECYLYAATPESIRVLSPIYHVNRTLVEFLTDGRSDYTISAILYQFAILVVFALIGIVATKKEAK